MDNQNIKKSSIRLMSFLLGFFLSLNAMSVYLFPADAESGGVASGGKLGIMYAGCVLLLFLASILSKTFSFKKIPKLTWLIIAYLLYFYFSTISLGEPHTKFNQFLVFSIIGLVIPIISRIDVRDLLLSIMGFTAPGILRISEIFLPLIQARGGSISMGYSYCFLAPVMATIVYLYYYYRKERNISKLFATVLVSINIVFAYFIIFYGSRGPVLAILLLLVTMYVVDYEKINSGIVFKKKKTIMVALAAVSCYFFFVPILTLLQSALSIIGINLHFIDKFIVLESVGNIASERDFLIEYTLSEFIQKPFMGHGFDLFQYNTNGLFPYPHNFITQILYDGGVVLFLLVMGPVLYNLRKWYRECTKDEFIVIIALLFASVPGSLFSGDLWSSSTLWVFFGATLSTSLIYKVNKKL